MSYYNLPSNVKQYLDDYKKRNPSFSDYSYDELYRDRKKNRDYCFNRPKLQ